MQRKSKRAFLSCTSRLFIMLFQDAINEKLSKQHVLRETCQSLKHFLQSIA